MFELYRTRFRREWRWRFKASNGRIIFASSEGYRNRGDAIFSIGIARRSASAEIRDLK